MNNKAQVLIVDNNKESLSKTVQILQEDSYNFLNALDVNKALEILVNKEQIIDLIIIEIMLPAMDGFEACRLIKKQERLKDIPVIFFTHKTDIDSINKGFAAGAIDYISKTCHADELIMRVKTHITLYHDRKHLKLDNDALKNKIALGQKRLTLELEASQKESILMLTELLDFASDEKRGHTKRVSEISSLLAYYHPDLNEEDAYILYHASPVHDIGKLTIPYELLHKPGVYSTEEFELMKKHTTNAYSFLSSSPRKFMQAAAIIAYQHHERWDGQGYPQKLKGEEIHLYGRIVALADVFDSLTRERSYKEVWKMQDAIDYIQQHNGAQFDPKLVDIFMNNFEQFTGIVENNKNDKN